jgi:TonB family protein
MLPRLTYACNEGWNKMDPNEAGRHCLRCNKEVLDLTQRTHVDLIAILREKNNSVCARVRTDQVYRYDQLPEVTILKPFVRPPSSHPILPWLAAGSLCLTACSNAITPQITSAEVTAPEVDQLQSIPEQVADQNDQAVDTKALPSDAAHAPVDEGLPAPFLEGDIVLGGIDGEMNSNWHSEVPETPAAFPGGYDSLMAFVRSELRFPEEESKAGITGTVVVSFKIDAAGRPFEASIIKDVRGSKNFGPEVLRVVEAMPSWTPAMRDGLPVVSQYSLPIRFSQ